MSLHDEIAIAAYEIYEKNGRVDGRDEENWLEAERIVQARYASGGAIEQKTKAAKTEIAKTKTAKPVAPKAGTAKAKAQP